MPRGGDPSRTAALAATARTSRRPVASRWSPSPRSCRGAPRPPTPGSAPAWTTAYRPRMHVQLGFGPEVRRPRQLEGQAKLPLRPVPLVFGHVALALFSHCSRSAGGKWDRNLSAPLRLEAKPNAAALATASWIAAVAFRVPRRARGRLRGRTVCRRSGVIRRVRPRAGGPRDTSGRWSWLRRRRRRR
jgi:hypothetical protein